MSGLSCYNKKSYERERLNMGDDFMSWIDEDMANAFEAHSSYLKEQMSVYVGRIERRYEG